MGTQASLKVTVSPSFQTPNFLSNLGRSPTTRPAMPSDKRLLVVSDFDHTLTRNDCGEQVANSLGLSSDAFFAEASRLAKINPRIERGGEFAAMALSHPKFARMTPATLTKAGAQVVLKENVGALISQLSRHYAGYDANFFVVSAGPQQTVRAALVKEGVHAHQVIGSRFAFDQTQRATDIEHVSAGAGKVEIIKDLQALLGVPGKNVIYFGDGSSDIAAMQYVQAQGGFNVAVQDHPELRPYRSTLFVSDDANRFLLPIQQRLGELDMAREATDSTRGRSLVPKRLYSATALKAVA